MSCLWDIIREILEKYFDEKMIVLGQSSPNYFITWNVKNLMMIEIERFKKLTFSRFFPLFMFQIIEIYILESDNIMWY